MKRTGFIGAGKVGTALGKFLAVHGVDVAGYASRRPESAAAAAAFTGTRAYADAASLLDDCDTVFLTVPDGQIAAVFAQLPAGKLAGKRLCHCSGSLTAAEAFPGIAAAGAAGCSIHPILPVSDRPDAFRAFEGAWFCLEGDGACVGDWTRVLEACGAHARAIAPESKARYHAACAISSNLVCALAAESVGLLAGCGFGRDEALAALAPLMRANLENILAVGPQEALTGPVERGDAGTVARHLDCLPTPAERELYRAASARLLPLARARHPETDYAALAALLGA